MRVRESALEGEITGRVGCERHDPTELGQHGDPSPGPQVYVHRAHRGRRTSSGSASSLKPGAGGTPAIVQGRDEKRRATREGLIMDEARIGLAEAVRSVRAELVAAMREGQDAELRFRTGPVELEFIVEAGRETSAGGGVRWWVVSAEGKVASESRTTHRITVSLTPVVPTVAPTEQEQFADAVIRDEVESPPT